MLAVAPWGAMSTAEPRSTAPHLPASEVGGLRERKKRTTRRALRLAGLSLVAEHGLEQVTAEEIAAEADVSPRTLFNYFASKEDVLVGSDPEVGAALSAALVARPAHESPLQALKQVFIEYAQADSMDEDMWRLRMRVVESNPVLITALIGASAMFGRELIHSVAARIGVDPAQDPYPALVVGVATAAVRSTLQHHSIHDVAQSIDILIAESFDAIMAGLPAPRS